MPRPSRVVVLPARDSRGCLVKPGDTVADHKGRRFVVESIDDCHVATMIGGAKLPTIELTLQAIGTGDAAGAVIAHDEAAREEVADWLATAKERASHGAIMAGSVRHLCANVMRSPVATAADKAAVAAILASL